MRPLLEVYLKAQSFLLGSRKPNQVVPLHENNTLNFAEQIISQKYNCELWVSQPWLPGESSELHPFSHSTKLPLRIVSPLLFGYNDGPGATLIMML